MTLFSTEIQLFELLGVFGFALYVLNYTMLTLRYISGDCMTYFAINLTAATCVLLGLSVSFNLAAALIQGFWVLMSLLGIALRLTRIRTAI